MGKQELSLKVVPDNATHKGLVVTLADSSLASITPTANGVELDARKGGTTSLKVESHHGEVTKTIPVNVQEATDLSIDGKLNTGARYVKDLPFINLFKKGNFVNSIDDFGRGGAHTAKLNSSGNLEITYDSTNTNRSNVFFNTSINFLPTTDSENIPLYCYMKMKSSNPVSKVHCELYGGTSPDGREVYISDEWGIYKFNLTKRKNISFFIWVMDNVDTTIEIEWINLFRTEFDSVTRHYPAPEDVGVVHGQPNLLDGTSGEWKEYTYTTWHSDARNVILDTVGLKVGDTISARSEIDNTAGSTLGYTKVIFKNAEGGAIREGSANFIRAGETGASSLETVIPEGTTYITWLSSASNSSTITTTQKTRRHKLVKGTLSAMGEWTPSQADSGLTIVNNGMVAFNSIDYANILAKDKVVRAETKIYGRGACIDLSFNVIEAISAKYPALFAGLTTIDQKIAKYHTLRRKVYIVQSSRGYGRFNGSADNWALVNSSQGNLFAKDGSTWALGTRNTTANFTETGTILTDNYANQVNKAGFYVLRVASYHNGGTDRGAVSDGVTPAWVEVKDARLEVSIQPPEDPNAKPITITVTPS